MIALEKNVPMPADTRGVPMKYPWKSMQVGDSFFVPTNKKTFTAHAYATRTLGYRFVTKQTVESGRKGFRVWRKL